MNRDQFRDLIERKLTEIGLHNEHAVNLLLGTAAQESHLGKYIRQLRGPALGVFQMEPATFNDICNNFLAYKPDLKQKIVEAAGIWNWDPAQLEWNLALAICMARVHYLRVPEALPTTVDGYADYWKKYYNTHLGRGSVNEFSINWHRFVTGSL